MAEENPAAQRQTAVTAYLSSKRLPLFVFAWRSVCQYSMAEENPAAQRQTAVTAYFTGKQLLLFVFAWRSVCQYSMAEENPAAQRQTAVTANFAGKQLLLFVFCLCMAVSLPVLDGRRESCSSKTNSSNCLLFK